jgi:acetyl-CoA carboxylase biotin carboxyl carrier protein
VSKKPSRSVAKRKPVRVPQVRAPKAKKKSSSGVDADLVRDLAKVLDDTGLTEIEVEYGELRLRLARTLVMAQQPPAHTHVVHSAPAPQAALPPPAAVAPAPAPAAPPAAPADAASHPGAVLSPMVGTAYLAANEDAPPFVKIGDRVSKGQTILLVEAMKTFNQIHATHDGVVKQILVGNADPVEFNQPLMIIE